MNLSLTKAGLLVAALSVGLLGGCSGRDADSAERVAEINAATERAEKAAERAEAAVAKLQNARAPVPQYEPAAEDPSPQDAPPPDEQPPTEL